MGVAQGTAVWSRLLLLLMLAMISFPCIIYGLPNEGLYVSNKTDILLILDPQTSPGSVSSVYKQGGRIVGLTYDLCNNLLFWSNIDVINRGIYRGSLNEGGQVDNVTKIVETDVLEVNSLSFDWVSRHLYWTDSRKKTIEVSDADGSNRRVLLMNGQGSPRGIYADPIHRHLFWTDQGRKHIARSQLDGSDQRVIVTQGVNLPNQIVVHNEKLYWVDSHSKTFESSDLNGDQRQTTTLKPANGQHIFGLALHDQTAYITNWVNGQLIAIDTDGTSVVKGTENLGREELFSAIYVKAAYQPKRDDPCAGKGCAALCLPVNETDTRCSCPSYGGKILNDADGKTCINPRNYTLLVAMADSGYVGFFDPSSTGKRERDFYVVGRSLRPVAVAYDPVTKNVFWSDVRERTIHLANIDGTNHQILLRGIHGVGLVEGMVVDATRRQLYYTNIGSVYIDATPYSWHRIETVSLQDLLNVKVKTIVTTADKPRGLALDPQSGHLYYTDWGIRASIVRVNLDGSDPTLIRTGLDNPNGIALLDNKLYFVDSHFKTRERKNELNPLPSKNGSLYSMNLDGSGFKDVLAETTVKLGIPFGLTATHSGLYVGDWESQNLTLLNLNGTLLDTIVQGTSGLMSLSYSPFTSTAGSNSCARSCGDICLSKTATEKSCTCNSYGGKSLDSTGASCSVPSKLMIVADMNSIKIVSLDGKDSNSYIAVQGNPFFSNFVGLAYNAVSRTVYYSDVNRKTINSLELSNMTKSVLYRINEVIDGLLFHDGSLYWTGYTSGRICRLPLRPPSGRELKHEILALNLQRPRGIRFHKNSGYIYWTEWGGKPKISRSRLVNGKLESKEQLFKSLNLVWPNGISFSGNDLYVADGSTRKIFHCSLNPNGNCQAINGTEEVMKHAYDLWATTDGVFYYSDWKTGAVNAFHPNKPGQTWTVVEGLMRPTQFYIFSQSDRPPACLSGTCSGGSCVPLLVNYGCDCQGKVPTYDLKNCTSESTTSCTYGDKSYAPGKSFSPSSCLNCKCVGAFSWANHPNYNTSVCERITCPKLNCDPRDVERKENECCLTCTKCRIQITNCPQEPVRLTLPSNQGYVLYDFLPTVRDCLGLAREVTTTRTPVGAIYKRGQTDVTVVSSAKQQNGNEVDKAECKIKVIVEDKTPPTIKCPADETAYLIGDKSSVEVRWSPPEVSDNDEIDGQPVASSSWGSSFGEGSHTVKYTVKDKQGLADDCSFKVKVDRLKNPQQGICTLPQVDNAQLQCTANAVLHCIVDSCHPLHKLVEPWDSKCSNGQWEKSVTDTVLHRTCIQETPVSARGSLRITVPAIEACTEGLDGKYTSDFLQDAIRRDHMLRSTAGELRSNVKVKGCASKWDDLIIDVDVVGRSGAPENLTSNVNGALGNIRKALEEEFMRVPLKDFTEIRIAHNLTIKTTGAIVGCLPGEIKKGEDSCEVCDVGTYHESGNSTCVKCAPDSYNDVKGQTECKPCPEGSKSGSGSYIADQCIQVYNYFLLTVVLAAVFALLVILLLVAVIVCARRRCASVHRVKQAQNQRLTINKTFNPDLDYDCTYDRIAEPLPENPLGNHYERLEASGGGAAENSYDAIDSNLLASCQPATAAEGNGADNGVDEDGKSTPPYLQPVEA